MLNRKFIIHLIGIVFLLDEIQAGLNDPLIPKQGSGSSSGVQRAGHVIREGWQEMNEINERGGLVWKRPDGIANYPNTWHEFPKNGGKFVIKDIPEDRYDEVVELIASIAFKTPVYVAAGVSSDPEAANNLKLRWKLMMKQKLAVACFENNKIVGISLFVVTRKNDSLTTMLPKTESAKLTKLFQLHKLVKMDRFKAYGVEEYLYSRFIGVLPGYEQYGIVEELFRIVDKICWKFSIQYSAFLLTSPELDQLAGSEGFILDKGVSYNDMRSLFPTVKSFNGYGYSIRSKSFKRQAYQPPN